MSAYLQRLLARAGVAPVPAAFTALMPVAPLASPLAEHDQRLGLPEFDGGALEGGAPDEGAAAAIEGESPARSPLQARVPEPRRFEAATLTPLDLDSPLRFELLEPAPAAPGPARFDPPPAPAGPADAPSFAAPRPFDIDPRDFEPAPEPLPPPRNDVESEPAPAADGQTMAPRLPSLDPMPSPVASPIREAAPAAIAWDPVPVPLPLPDAEPAARRPAEEDRAGTASTAIAAEPMPAEPAGQDRAPPIEAEPASPAAPAPVVIEEVVIEVREPAQPASAGRDGRNGRAAPMPSTAAAASMIGPLPVRCSAVTLYGMRRR